MAFQSNLNIKISREDHDWLRKTSGSTDTSIAELVRRAIRLMREKTAEADDVDAAQMNPFFDVVGICEGATHSMNNEELDRTLYGSIGSGGAA